MRERGQPGDCPDLEFVILIDLIEYHGLSFWRKFPNLMSVLCQFLLISQKRMVYCNPRNISGFSERQFYRRTAALLNLFP